MQCIPGGGRGLGAGGRGVGSIGSRPGYSFGVDSSEAKVGGANVGEP